MPRAMIPRALLAAVGSVLLVTAVSAQGRTASNKELEARANELESRLATIERSAANLVPMQQQIEAARSELRNLRGQIEEARHELELLRQQQILAVQEQDRATLDVELNDAVERYRALKAPAAGETPPRR